MKFILMSLLSEGRETATPKAKATAVAVVVAACCLLPERMT